MFDASIDLTRGHPYRAYTLNAAGRIFKVDVVRAADDAQARRNAQALVQYYVIELWDRTRLVGRFTPERPLLMETQDLRRGETSRAVMR